MVTEILQNPGLLRYVTRRMPNGLKQKLDPCDIIQQVAIRCMDRGDEPNPTRLWYRIAHDIIIDEYRRVTKMSCDHRRDTGDLDDVQQTETDLVEAQDTARAVWGFVEQLDAVSRQVLISRYRDDDDTAETCRLTGLLPNAVWMRTLRAIRKLRTMTEHLQ